MAEDIWNGVWKLYSVKRSDMFPMWFFIILIVLIGYLLYITRPSEESFTMMCKNQLDKMTYWIRPNSRT